MSAYIYWINGAVPAEHVATADAIGALVGTEPGDVHAFSRGVKLRAIGDEANALAAYGVALPVKHAAHAAVLEFNGEGPWPTLDALGAQEQAITAAKAVVSVETGARADLEQHALEFWASLGYEPAARSLANNE